MRLIKYNSKLRYKSELGRKSVKYRDPILWDAIHKVIRDILSLRVLKRSLKIACLSLDHIQSVERDACLVSSKNPDLFSLAQYYVIAGPHQLYGCHIQT